MSVLTLPRPYLLFLGDVTDLSYAKTAAGLRDWVPDQCVAEWSLPGNPLRLGLPVMAPAEAVRAGARSLVIGAATMGGALRPAWIPALLEAMEAGLDIISGMHMPLASVSELKATADRLGRQLIDVRRPPEGLPLGTGRKRTGKRLLTVGTDCALGKKYTALALTRAFGNAGVKASFRATGQTGILIAGGGIPMDAVVSDFLAGAAEALSPDAPADHWDIVEGQGSLFHPSYAGVSLGLLHGSQPDVLVICHEFGRKRIIGLEANYPVPSIDEVIELNLMHARRVNPDVRVGGISLNTSRLSEEEARRAIDAETRRTGLPCADPIRGGAAFDALVEACLEPEAALVQ
ncbi:MAG: Protein often near L-alanine-DL-glutamate epimerase (cell wall recycling) [Oceanicaulis sp. HLUCCA04]|nr:MAG: Protein often near L-alanine-DL-glutamate epimerase (cell wall recycling) [Oceanicaulis sp. HLUCCA04]